jgi:hypothetical protein
MVKSQNNPKIGINTENPVLRTPANLKAIKGE